MTRIWKKKLSETPSRSEIPLSRLPPVPGYNNEETRQEVIQQIADARHALARIEVLNERQAEVQQRQEDRSLLIEALRVQLAALQGERYYADDEASSSL